MPDGPMTRDSQGYSTPKPDPTVLTTEQLMREVTRLESIINLQIEAVDERLHAEIKLTDARILAGTADRAVTLILTLVTASHLVAH